MEHEWLKELRKLVRRRAPGWLLRWMTAAYWPLPKGRPKRIILPVPGGPYVRFPFRFFGPSPDSLFPDEHYFRILKPGKGETVLNMGACAGASASMAARMVGEEGLVVAVEPDPDNLRWLRLNLGRLPNVVVVPKGVADRKGHLLLYRNPIGPGHTILYSLGGESVEIEVTTIDRICRELKLGRVDFMMMDIEGAELMALRGARRMLKRTRKVVVGVHHRVRGKLTWPRVKRLLEGRGFRTVMEGGFVHAWKES
jgi:FkbM family methyltransferase